MARLTLVGTILLLLTQTGCSVVGIRTTPEPEFTVVAADGAFELRQYGELVVAETTAEGPYSDASSTTFRRLFRYISGENSSTESIAMTAPVGVQSASAEDDGESIAMTAPVLVANRDAEWTLSFVLPAEYTLENAPVPTEDGVRLNTVPPRTVAVVRYSGLQSAEKMIAQEERLRAWMDAQGYQSLGAARAAGYDPPWALPFLRRNEVMIDVAEPTRIPESADAS